MAIDWDDMCSGDFITLKVGEPKTLVLKDWKEQTQFKDDKTGEIRPGVEFTVIEEDGVVLKTPKSYNVTAKGALKQYAPLCKKAEAEGKDSIKVEIVAVGEGKSRQYSIRAVN